MNTLTSSTDAPHIFKSILIQIAFYGFAIFNWFLYLGLSIRSGTFFKKSTEQDQLRFAISRDRFWNLSKQPIPGFEHAFFKLRNGLKLHYITNRLRTKTGVDKKVGSGNLFIFLHGFPDSSVMWRYCLKEPAIPMRSARLVCVDLPNYGGSDTFKIPDAAVLEALTEFILAMREEHEEAASDGKNFSTVIVAHDWGCVIGFKLAAEAPQLADRFVLTNGPHVGLSLANKDRVLASSSKIFKQFKESPRQHFGCLSKSFNSVKPLLIQVLMFGYIFAFHLPRPLVVFLGTGGNFAFLRGALRSAHGKHKDEWSAQESLASTLGPGVIEVDTKTAAGEGYGESVQERAASPGAAFWHQTAYYRSGLAFGSWEKSLETIAELHNLESNFSASPSISPVRRRSSSSASSTIFTDQYNGALKAPTTLLWGEHDLAIGKTICLDGIGDYLGRGSEVILLSHTGHWTPVEREGRAALAKIVGVCAAAGDNLPVYMAKEVDEVYQGSTSLIRK